MSNNKPTYQELEQRCHATEEALRLSREHLALTLEAAQAGTWEWNLKTNKNTWSEELWALYGLEPHSCQPSYEAWQQTVHPDDRAKAAQTVQTAAAQRTRLIAEWRVLDPDGAVRWLLSRGKPIRDADGEVICYLGIVFDITERKQAEEAALISEARYRHTLDAMLEGCQILGLDWHYLYLNDVADKHNRRPKEELLGRNYVEMWPGIESTEVFQLLRQGMEERLSQSMENEFVFPDGNLGWFEIRVYPVPQGIVIFSIDITERKQVEQALRTAFQRFQVMLSSLYGGILVVSNDGLVEFANQAFCDLFDLDDLPQELIGMSAPEIIRKIAHVYADPAVALARIQEIVANGHGQPLQGEEIAMTGERTYIRDFIPIMIGGKRYGRIWHHFDITERKHAEEALRASSARYRLISENAADVIWVLDPMAGRFTYVSPSVEKLRGYTPAEVMNQPVAQSLTPESLRLVQEGVAVNLPTFIARGTGTESFTNEVDQPCKDGSIVQTEVTTTYLFNEQGQVEIVGVSRDITDRKRAERALRESEERLRAFIDNAESLVWIKDLDGRFLVVNPYTEDVLGLPKEQIIGRTVHALFPKQYADIFASNDRQVLDLGKPLEFEEVSLLPDGQHTYLSVKFPLCDATGQIYALGAICTDITGRKQAEEELNRLNAELEQRVARRTAELSDLYNNAPCGYHSLDNEGVIVRINNTELAWLGYTREEVVGKMTATDLFTPASLEAFKHNFPLLKARGWIENLELEMIRRDGSILPVLLNATAIRGAGGRFLFSRSTMINYTERKQAEMALRQSQAQLQVANKELEAFAYSVSHDLRAPLRGIDGWSLALLEDYYDQLDETARQYLDRVRAEAQRMGRLIDDLLLLSRASRAEMHKNRVDLSHLAHIVVGRLRDMEPDRQVQIVIQPGLVASGDITLLEAVLTNLLGNAFKFSSGCAEAQIEFGCLLPDKDAIKAEGRPNIYFVRDNGAGFDMAYAARLFGAFQRLHKTSEFPGTGIGRAICQHITHRHGGQVWAEAEVGRGATFYFTLEEAA